MLARFAAGPVNHVLRQQSWALERLRAHAGKRVRFVAPPFDLDFLIRESGELEAHAAGEDAVEPDALFRATPGLLLRVAAGDAAALQEVAASGDPALAADAMHLAKNLRWDAEEDLSSFVGDIPAHRIAEGLARVRDWGAQAAASMAANVAEYLTEEQPVAAKAPAVAEFVSEVDRLRDDVERIEKRIASLEALPTR